MAVSGSTGFLGYLKQAFLFRWNLLAVAGGVAAAVLSGKPDVVLPLLAAGEILYLAGLSSRSRFRAAVDAAQHQRRLLQEARQSEKRARLILAGLSQADQERFLRLRGLCRELGRLAQGMRGAGAAGAAGDMGPAEELQQGGINRLLWIYLKMLHSKNALEHFFATIDEQEIRRTITRTRERLAGLGAEAEDTPGQAKQRRSLQDTLATSESRLDNYRRARENYDLVQLELDRLYTKIASLGELGINRQDPEFITSEVDSVSASVEQTEKAMSELEFLTGLTSGADEATPELLAAEVEQQQLAAR
ncbi:MAG: hypothetical protein FJ125_00820 [Deltaproteobacteria bacterium]|nr:hypothetical protein [Deltaproteobacteria bacterium]